MAYPTTLYVRIVNPGTYNEFILAGTEPSSVADEAVGSEDSLAPEIARYQLVGTGRIQYSAPRYVENTKA